MCVFSSKKARIKRYTHNDLIMSAVPLTQDKWASMELIATSQQWKGGWSGGCHVKRFLRVWMMKSEKNGNLLSRKTRGHSKSAQLSAGPGSMRTSNVDKSWSRM